MKKRILSLALALVMALSCAPMAGAAIQNQFAGMSTDCAKAYLNLVDQEIRTHGYTTTQYFPMTPGFVGGFIRDFDQNGTPELYLVSVEEYYFDYAGLAREQVWTWNGSRAIKVFDNEIFSNGGRAKGFTSEFHIVNGKGYYVDSSSGLPSIVDVWVDSGTIYTVDGTTWKEVLYYSHSEPFNETASMYPEEFYTEANGKKTYYKTEAAYRAVLANYLGNSTLLVNDVMQCMEVGFAPNGRTLRNQLSQLASNQPSSWAADEVRKAENAGLVPSLTGNPTYQGTISRLQFCQLAVQLAETALGESLPAAPANTFTDCSDLAVRKAYAAKIVNGMTETTFSPNGTLTREQLATMLWRAVNYIQTQSGEQALTGGGSLTGYTDAGSVSSYAKEAVSALNKNGIMKGTSNTALSPKGSCTVEQSVLLSYRTFLKLN